MKRSLLTFALLTTFAGQVLAVEVINHKSAYCGCCSEWTKHMQQHGFSVKEVIHEDMDGIKQQLGLAPKLASCHTAEIGGYVFEGHISAQDIQDFLANPPKNAKGLAVPGMPIGSPGMEYGDKKDSYAVYAFNEHGQVFEYRFHQGN